MGKPACKTTARLCDSLSIDFSYVAVCVYLVYLEAINVFFIAIPS